MAPFSLLHIGLLLLNPRSVTQKAVFYLWVVTRHWGKKISTCLLFYCFVINFYLIRMIYPVVMGPVMAHQNLYFTFLIKFSILFLYCHRVCVLARERWRHREREREKAPSSQWHVVSCNLFSISSWFGACTNRFPDMFCKPGMLAQYPTSVADQMKSSSQNH